MIRGVSFSRPNSGLPELGISKRKSGKPDLRAGEGSAKGAEFLRTSYNHVAGQNIHRLEALSDGVFVVAMTLLVLDLHTPAAAANERRLRPGA